MQQHFGLPHRLGWGKLALGIAVCVLAAAVPVSAARGEAGSGSSGSAPSPERPKYVASDSPRASLSRYFELARKGQFKEASRYLEVPERLNGRRKELAERLKVVLDRNIWFDMDLISGSSKGNLDDGLEPHEEDIGGIEDAEGTMRSVRMVRRQDANGGRWMFSQATVALVDGWYDLLGDRWIRSHLPEFLLRPGPHELLWWQWMALPLVLVAAWIVGRALGWLTRRLLRLVLSRTATKWDDILLEQMRSTLTLVWGIAAVFFLLPWLSLYAPAEIFLHRILGASFYFVVFWALFKAVDVAAEFFTTSTFGLRHGAVGAFIPLGRRIAKVVVLAMAVIAIFSELGFPVASLIAGLGIGGLALALAAQKTVENLFGSISLGVDQPIRVGDFVKVEDFVGTVEWIGLRSTRIRTLDRTMISLPNGRLADMRLETFAPRDRIRFTTIIGLVYQTTESQMRNIVQRCEGILRNHPKVWKEAIRVVFIQFGQSALEFECLCWFETADYNEFNYLRQDVLFQFMKVVEEEGSSFAFPTRTIHMVQSSPDPVAPPEAVPANKPI